MLVSPQIPPLLASAQSGRPSPSPNQPRPACLAGTGTTRTWSSGIGRSGTVGGARKHQRSVRWRVRLALAFSPPPPLRTPAPLSPPVSSSRRIPSRPPCSRHLCPPPSLFPTRGASASPRVSSPRALSPSAARASRAPSAPRRTSSTRTPLRAQPPAQGAEEGTLPVQLPGGLREGEGARDKCEGEESRAGEEQTEVMLANGCVGAQQVMQSAVTLALPHAPSLAPSLFLVHAVMPHPPPPADPTAPPSTAERERPEGEQQQLVPPPLLPQQQQQQQQQQDGEKEERARAWWGRRDATGQSTWYDIEYWQQHGVALQHTHQPLLELVPAPKAPAMARLIASAPSPSSSSSASPPPCRRIVVPAELCSLLLSLPQHRSTAANPCNTRSSPAASPAPLPAPMPGASSPISAAWVRAAAVLPLTLWHIADLLCVWELACSLHLPSLHLPLLRTAITPPSACIGDLRTIYPPWAPHPPPLPSPMPRSTPPPSPTPSPLLLRAPPSSLPPITRPLLELLGDAFLKVAAALCVLLLHPTAGLDAAGLMMQWSPTAASLHAPVLTASPPSSVFSPSPLLSSPYPCRGGKWGEVKSNSRSSKRKERMGKKWGEGGREKVRRSQGARRTRGRCVHVCARIRTHTGRFLRRLKARYCLVRHGVMGTHGHAGHAQEGGKMLHYVSALKQHVLSHESLAALAISSGLHRHYRTAAPLPARHIAAFHASLAPPPVAAAHAHGEALAGAVFMDAHRHTAAVWQVFLPHLLPLFPPCPCPPHPMTELQHLCTRKQWPLQIKMTTDRIPAACLPALMRMAEQGSASTAVPPLPAPSSLSPWAPAFVPQSGQSTAAQPPSPSPVAPAFVPLSPSAASAAQPSLSPLAPAFKSQSHESPSVASASPASSGLGGSVQAWEDKPRERGERGGEAAAGRVEEVQGMAEEVEVVRAAVEVEGRCVAVAAATALLPGVPCSVLDGQAARRAAAATALRALQH
ncbi:hypothetical protein CLOM_g23485 [Closterium sp. NIES-68]|nr:hypothetical protein CLOM_g23485 [Closterium sp. NIES-68]